MLESMTSSPTPTRAEASDVATAIYDGADAVMLSAESATGQFACEAVEVMDRIIRRTEGHETYARAVAGSREPVRTAADAIAETGSALASSLGGRCIVAYSMSGSTAKRIAARRPDLPLIVLTRDIEVSRRLALVWGVHSELETKALDYESMLSMAREESGKLVDGKTGDNFVIVAGVPFGVEGSTNNIRVANF